MALLTLAAATPAGARATSLADRIAERMPQASTDAQRQKFIDVRDVLTRDQYWLADETGGDRRYRFHLEPLRAWRLGRHSL